MMEWFDFEAELIRRLESLSGGSVHASADSVSVNNRQDSRILRMQKEECRLMPVIHLEEYEKRYREGETLEKLAEEILEMVRSAGEGREIPEDFFREYASLEERIFCRVIGADRNRALLEQIPHERLENLAIVYYYRMPEQWMADATILIRHEHLELWKCSVSRLRKTAWRNTMEKQKVKFCELSSIFAELGVPEMEGTEEAMLYLLTNEEGSFGAAAAFYPGVLSRCAETIGSDLILLPSSIHEWLLLSADSLDEERNPEFLRGMVREVNSTQVAEKEILSDEVYYYDRDTDRIGML